MLSDRDIRRALASGEIYIDAPARFQPDDAADKIIRAGWRPPAR